MTDRVVWAIFAAAWMASTAAGIDPILSLVGHYGGGWETGTLVLIAYLAYVAGKRQSHGDHLAAAMALAGIIGSGYLLIQWLGLDPWVWRGRALAGIGNGLSMKDGTGPRMMGLMGNSTYSGFMVALSAAMSPIALAGPLIASIYMTGSRAAMLAGAAAMAYKAWPDRRARIGIVVLAILAAGTLVAKHRPNSDRQHLAHNLAALHAWKHRPLLGWGPATGAGWYVRTRTPETTELMGGSPVLLVHSHNLVTNVLASQGVVGLFAWALLLAAGWRLAGATTRASLIAAAVFGSLEPIPHVAYVILALAVGMDYGRVPDGQKVPSAVPPWTIGMPSLLLACVLMVYLTWCMAADRLANRGHWGAAYDRVPWELGYAQHISDGAIRLLRQRPGNPIVYPVAIKALRDTGRGPEAEAMTVKLRTLLP